MHLVCGLVLSEMFGFDAYIDCYFMQQDHQNARLPCLKVKVKTEFQRTNLVSFSQKMLEVIFLHFFSIVLYDAMLITDILSCETVNQKSLIILIF